MADTKPRFNWQPIILGAVGIVMLVLGVLLVRHLIAGNSGHSHKPPKISLMPTTPPPPPPPPKEEKKPEPPKEQKVEQVVEQKIAPPDSPVLKMEGAAGDGPSMFAAGKVTSEDLSKLGGGGAGIGGRMQFGLYIDRLQRHLQEQLNRNRKLRQTDYRVTLSIWLAPDGSVRRADLGQTTGNSSVDDLLKQALLQVAAMREPPPGNMPQPIRVRITARGNT